MVISESKKDFYVVRINGKSGYVYFEKTWEPYPYDDDDDYGNNFSFTSFISSAYPFRCADDSLPKYLFSVEDIEVNTVEEFAKAVSGEIVQVEKKEVFTVLRII